MRERRRRKERRDAEREQEKVAECGRFEGTHKLNAIYGLYKPDLKGKLASLNNSVGGARSG